MIAGDAFDAAAAAEAAATTDVMSYRNWRYLKMKTKDCELILPQSLLPLLYYYYFALRAICLGGQGGLSMF